MLNPDCAELIKFDTNLKDEDINPLLRKAIQIANLYVEEKNQNWLWFRWVIWEEVCRQMPVKTTQPLWPFGKLEYYNRYFKFGILDVWVAKYWHSLNNGILFLENRYLEKPTVKQNLQKLEENNEAPKQEQSAKTQSTQQPPSSDFLADAREKRKLFTQLKEFTAAKYDYLSEEERKFNVQTKQKRDQKSKRISRAEKKKIFD
jgi:hypothetical protein